MIQALQIMKSHKRRGSIPKNILSSVNSNILELHFTLCTFLQIDIAVLWGELQHLNNPEAWWMTNTTRKLRVQDILATTHHQDDSQCAAPEQQRHLWVSPLSPFLGIEAQALGPAGLHWYCMEQSICNPPQSRRWHSTVRHKPPLVQVYHIPAHTASTRQKATPKLHLLRTVEMSHTSNCSIREFHHLI